MKAIPTTFDDPPRPHRKKISRVTRLAVYQRDAWACQGCGQGGFTPTDGRNAPYILLRNPKTGELDYVWLEMDHIVPYSHGGPDTRENLRSACSKCNQSRNARPLPQAAQQT